MIDRFAFVRLASSHATVVGRADTINLIRNALAELPGLIRLTLGTPAADASADKWDLAIVARFVALPALTAAMTTVAWASVFEDLLPARSAVIKAWSFDVDDAGLSPLR